MTEFRPSNFQMIPTIVKNLIIINVLVYLAEITFGKDPGFNMQNLFALHAWQASLFKPWQFLTYMFMHDPNDFMHILFNMIGLWMFGSVLENLWGPRRFLIFYIVCGLGAALCHMLAVQHELQPIVNTFNAMDVATQNANYADYVHILNQPTIVGASGAVVGCLAAFGYLFPNDYVYLYFAIPIKVKWAVTLFIGGEIASEIIRAKGDNVAHVAHLGGALVGFILVYYWNKTNRKTFY